jgi:hypothetical protein
MNGSSELTALGKIVKGMAIAACAAIVVLAVFAVVDGDEGVMIALAAVPVVLAFVVLVWPSAPLRKPSEGAPDLPPSPAEAVGDKFDDALGQLLDVARDQANIEEDRHTATANRAGLLLGFAGVILALAGAQAKNVFDNAASLGSVGRPLGTWFLMAAAVMTAVAAVCALRALLPRPGIRITAEKLAGFLEPSIYENSRSNIRYSQLRVLVEQIAEDRASNERGLDWIKAGFTALVIALLFLLLHVGVYLERTVSSPCPKASGHALQQAASKSFTPTTKLALLDSPPAVESSPGSSVTLLPVNGDNGDLADARGPPPCFGTEKYGK